MMPPLSLVFDLSPRTKFRLTGADRLRFLNGQVTNDVRKATGEAAIHACVITAKGKTNGDLFVSAQPDFLLLDADAELRESLAARLDRYIIADDVQLEDVTDDFALFHVMAELPEWTRGKAVRAERFGVAGWDLWAAAGEHDAALAELVTQFSVCDADATEALEIERGIPRWGRELTEEIIPLEAGLEASCVDYSKGCYIGQEVISRMKMSGQTNKRLCGFVSSNGTALAPGMQLAAEGKEVGWITSAAFSVRLEKWIALGYAKRGYNDVGSELTATENAVTITPLLIVELPFAAA